MEARAGGRGRYSTESLHSEEPVFPLNYVRLWHLNYNVWFFYCGR